MTERRVIGGRYQLGEALGEGGMGTVYKGEEVGAAGFRKVVAVKNMKPPVGLPHTALELWTRKFKEEALLMGLLSHSNVVQIVTFLDERDEHFIVMEYVDGTTARGIMHDRGTDTPEAVIAYILAEACKGLTYLHDFQNPDGSKAHIIHRDISPQNIFISKKAEVKLGDLGVAKALNAPWRKKTIGNLFIGNPSYSSLESTMQDPDTVLDGRTDIYSLGVVGYEMCTGTTPFAGNSFSVNMAQRAVERGEQSVPSAHQLNSQISPAFSRVLEKAMALRRENRFQSAEEMYNALVEACPVSGFQPLKKILVQMFAEPGKIVVAAQPHDQTYRPNAASAPVAAEPVVDAVTARESDAAVVAAAVHDHSSPHEVPANVPAPNPIHLQPTRALGVPIYVREKPSASAPVKSRRTGAVLVLAALPFLVAGIALTFVHRTPPAVIAESAPGAAAPAVVAPAPIRPPMVAPPPAPPTAPAPVVAATPLVAPEAAAPASRPASERRVESTSEHRPMIEVSKDSKLSVKMPGQKSAEVFVDGLPVKLRSDGYSLPEGVHHIRVRDPETTDEKSKIIHVTAGKSLRTPL